jgi:hypothetical protein
VDGIKIDRSFVTNFAHNPTDRAVAAAVISLGHALSPPPSTTGRGQAPMTFSGIAWKPAAAEPTVDRASPQVVRTER